MPKRVSQVPPELGARPRLITLLRHGEAAWPQYAFLGACDPQLSAHGRAAMTAAIAALDEPPITAVVTSPLARCREVAAAFAAERELSINVAPALAEMRFGGWEGLTVEEVRIRDGALLEAFQADPARATPPGGERYGDFLRRVRSQLETLAKAHEDHTLVVTHAGVIRAVLAIVLGFAPSAWWSIALPEVATCRLSLFDGAPPCLLALNFVPRGR